MCNNNVKSYCQNNVNVNNINKTLHPNVAILLVLPHRFFLRIVIKSNSSYKGTAKYTRTVICF